MSLLLQFRCLFSVWIRYCITVYFFTMISNTDEKNAKKNQTWCEALFLKELSYNKIEIWIRKMINRHIKIIHFHCIYESQENMSEGENVVPDETFPRFFPTFWSLLSFTLNCGQKAILIYTKHILKLKGNEEKRTIKKCSLLKEYCLIQRQFSELNNKTFSYNQ